MSPAPRFALFLGLWLVLSDAAPAGLPFGVLAAGLACWASLRLRPEPLRMTPFAMLRLAGHVAWQAVKGGVDVAGRAFNPRLPLRPGLVPYTPLQAPGMGRDMFTALASLAPGSLPAGLDGEGRVVVHALDTAQDVAGELTALERLHG
jgi:multicomponent Na+:H+ antiporter subunit E